MKGSIFWVCTKADNFQFRPVVGISIGTTSLGPGGWNADERCKQSSVWPAKLPGCYCWSSDNPQRGNGLRVSDFLTASFYLSAPTHNIWDCVISQLVQHLTKKAGGWNARAPFDQLPGCYCWSSDNPQREIGLRVSLRQLNCKLSFSTAATCAPGSRRRWWKLLKWEILKMVD